MVELLAPFCSRKAALVSSYSYAVVQPFCFLHPLLAARRFFNRKGYLVEDPGGLRPLHIAASTASNIFVFPVLAFIPFLLNRQRPECLAEGLNGLGALHVISRQLLPALAVMLPLLGNRRPECLVGDPTTLHCSQTFLFLAFIPLLG